MFGMKSLMWCMAVVCCMSFVSAHSHSDLKNDPRSSGDLALWIDEKQVKMFSGKKQ